MRYMVMHKVDAQMEAGGPPDPTIIGGMHKLVQRSLADGTFLDGAGLHRSARRVRVTFAGGRRTVLRGPYGGGHELCASCVMIRTGSIDDAVEHAARYAEVLGDIEIEIGPVVEAWDLGIAPAPEGNPPGRYLLLFKATPDSERGAPRPPKVEAELRRLEEQLQGDGVLLKSERLAPSSRAARLPSAAQGKRTWTDGPFAETKELIAGFSILELPDRSAALAWADRYAAILGDNEVDVRELSSPP